MVNDIKLMDKIQLQKYIFLLELLITKKIETDTFEKYFLQTRRLDSYWLTGSFDPIIERVLNTFFLDVDEYNPENLYDPNDQYNINENELLKRAAIVFVKLKDMIG
ncbi:MAG: colicin immunity domain-containing protein [Candidatus Kapaibacterium sp.]